MILDIDANTFSDEVLKVSGPVMVDLGAEWCSPCRMLEPIVEEIAEIWYGRVKVVKIDVDESPDIAMNYQVMGVPTLLLFSDGELIDRITGYKPKDGIISAFEKYL